MSKKEKKEKRKKKEDGEKKEKRKKAGSVSDFISREFRAVDAPSKNDILELHAKLKRVHGYSLLNTTDRVSCLSAKVIFILEKRKAGYELKQIPACVGKRKNIINRYYSIRIDSHAPRYLISKGSIAKARTVNIATRGFRGAATATSPCQ